MAADGEVRGGGGGGGAADVECVTDNLRGLLTLNTSDVISSDSGNVLTHPHQTQYTSLEIPNKICGNINRDLVSPPTSFTPSLTTSIVRNGIKSSTESQVLGLEIRGVRSKLYSDEYYNASEINRSAPPVLEFHHHLNTDDNVSLRNPGLEESTTSNEDWTILKDFLSFRHPQETSRDSFIDTNDQCGIENKHSRSPSLSQKDQVKPEGILSSPPIPTNFQTSPENIQPLPSINTLVRGNVDSVQFVPAQCRELLNIQQDGDLDLNKSYDKDTDYNRRLIYNERDYSQLESAKEVPSPNSASYNPPTPVPVDLSRADEYRSEVYRDSYRLNHIRSESPNYTSRYLLPNQHFAADEEKLSELKSALNGTKDTAATVTYEKEPPVIRTNFLSYHPVSSSENKSGDKKKFDSPEYRSPIPSIESSHRSVSPFLQPTEPSSAFKSVSPSLSPEASGDDSQRPPVSLLRDLLVVGKPVRSPSPQHEQVRYSQTVILATIVHFAVKFPQKGNLDLQYYNFVAGRLFYS